MKYPTTIERRNRINAKQFKDEYLALNKPVIITDAMSSWQLLKDFTPNYLKKMYGDQEVQVYDDLFTLSGIMSLGEYIDAYCDVSDLNQAKDTKIIVPYVRWYTKLKNHEFIWADDFFNQLQSEWDLPYFLPTENYILPQSTNNTILSTTDLFPGKAIFVSAKNARTKLHYDPWCSDAVLCQIYGTKEITMYPPSYKEFLCHGNECVDIDNPDYIRFSKYKEYKNPFYVDILKPGEIVYLPNNWLHHVTTLTDSISLTWNFVHITTAKSFINYLMNETTTQEKEVINFFINYIK